MGKAKLRRRKYSSGMSGSEARRSTRTNSARNSGATANDASTGPLVQPASGPPVMAKSRAVTPTASTTEPATSKRWRCSLRSVSGSTAAASPSAASISGTWPTKIMRHENASTSGPPITTPRTGPPAITRDQ